MNTMPDTIRFEAKKEIVRLQILRFKIFYEKYFFMEETRQMADYFFNKVYSTEGKAEWILLAKTTFEKVKNMIKEQTKRNIEQLIELNDLTDILDTDMADVLLENGWQVGDKLNLEEYNQVYTKYGRVDQRKKQLAIVLKNMQLFYDLAHRPINAVIMKPAKFMSKMLGVYLLFASVEEGYHAILPVHKDIFNNFYKEVEEKEWKYIYSLFPEEKN